jgi:hypothetical protein
LPSIRLAGWQFKPWPTFSTPSVVARFEVALYVVADCVVSFRAAGFHCISVIAAVSVPFRGVLVVMADIRSGGELTDEFLCD